MRRRCDSNAFTIVPFYGGPVHLETVPEEWRQWAAVGQPWRVMFPDLDWRPLATEDEP